ncbi:unnamed protein product [Owenia fusiformis]|uniref:Uncharacterized protein n=1 Tax=Owenia fusiformis TaxID=6347 RepID=A0A8J1T7G2_OWEFU|nr:unnamed protein product [Owenia fusiformis]
MTKTMNKVFCILHSAKVCLLLPVLLTGLENSKAWECSILTNNASFPAKPWEYTISTQDCKNDFAMPLCEVAKPESGCPKYYTRFASNTSCYGVGYKRRTAENTTEFIKCRVICAINFCSRLNNNGHRLRIESQNELAFVGNEIFKIFQNQTHPMEFNIDSHVPDPCINPRPHKWKVVKNSYMYIGEDRNGRVVHFNNSLNKAKCKSYCNNFNDCMGFDYGKFKIRRKWIIGCVLHPYSLMDRPKAAIQDLHHRTVETNHTYRICDRANITTASQTTPNVYSTAGQQIITDLVNSTVEQQNISDLINSDEQQSVTAFVDSAVEQQSISALITSTVEQQTTVDHQRKHYIGTTTDKLPNITRLDVSNIRSTTSVNLKHSKLGDAHEPSSGDILMYVVYILIALVILGLFLGIILMFKRNKRGFVKAKSSQTKKMQQVEKTRSSGSTSSEIPIIASRPM